ncbi:MAG: FAD-dependent monooxygenase [Actinomycetota bacterium]|jgi:salicylate hydroxylase|nr:FAD-dependent monooxygenase [Actinomycetota bacterium]
MSTSRPPRVLVVGAGIGGLTAAIALARRNFEVEVLEQRTSSVEIGASLSLGPNAVRLLDDLGLGAAIRNRGATPLAVDLLRWDDGRLLHRSELGPRMVEHFGAPQLDFFRPELHDLLLWEAQQVASVRFGARVVGVFEEGERCRVALEAAGGEDAGENPADATVVVGADGVSSTVRQLLVGRDRPVFSGTVVYRGIADRRDVSELHPPAVNCYWLGPNRHGVSYWLSHGERLAVTCAVRDATWSRESWTLETEPTEVLGYLAGWHEPFLERIRRCRLMLRSAVYVRQPLEQWSYGLVTLLGDAAHAMQPFEAQGAAQAIEDAYVLAACLAEQPGDPRAALRRYARIRIARTRELQDSSREAAESFYLPDGEAQRRRDADYQVLHERQPWGPRQPLWEYDVREVLRREPVSSGLAE